MTVIPGEEQAVFGGGIHQDAAIGDPGGSSPFAPYQRNPGTRVMLKREAGLTKNGVLDHPLVLPVPPLDNLTRNLTYEWADYQTISAGQFSRPSGMDLQTINFDTVIVEDDYSWAFYNPLRTRGWDSAEFVRQLGQILRSASPFRLVIEEVRFKANSTAVSGITFDFGTAPLLSMLATLRTLSSTDRSGEPETRYISLGFVEHRSADVQQRALNKGGSGSANSKSGGSIGGSGSGKGGVNSRKLPALIGMQAFKGTPTPPAKTLYGLATFYYGSAAKWTLIKQSNSWLGNVTGSQDLSDWTTSELKTAGKANRRLTIPVIASSGRQ